MMSNLVDTFSGIVRKKLRTLGFSSPNAKVVRTLIETAHLATLRTEEGRFVRGSLTFADPSNPDIDPPLIRRLDYPTFTSFGKRTPLSVEALIKFSRAIDRWSGSIAVYDCDGTGLVVWGVLDQLVHHNIQLNREPESAPPLPGTLTITMDGVGDLSAYHGGLFLGGLRQNRLLTNETDALRSGPVVGRISPTFRPIAAAISRVLNLRARHELLESLLEQWSCTMARLCIGLRRLGTGGAFILSPSAVARLLDINSEFQYSRLRDSSNMSVFDTRYVQRLNRQIRGFPSQAIDRALVRELQLARADLKDRGDELTGAVKVVTGLAGVDGLVLMTPDLAVLGFGVKVRSGIEAGKVYDGQEYSLRRRKAQAIDLNQFGTRHLSMIRYCREDSRAVGITVSQDGPVRLIVSSGQDLTLWNDVQLLQYESDVREYVRERNRAYEYRQENKKRARVGYTETPKTVDALMRSKLKSKTRTNKRVRSVRQTN